MTGDRGLATGDFQECSILFFYQTKGVKSKQGQGHVELETQQEGGGETKLEYETRICGCGYDDKLAS